LQIINSADSFISQSDDSFVQIAVKTLDKKGLEAIKKNYIFSFDDNVIQLKDLSLQSIKVTDDIYNLIISGNINFLKRYIAILKKLETKKSIEINNIELTEVKQTKRKNIPISNEMFEKIKNYVPPQPWEKGMHKMIASKFGISHTLAQAVIRKLISDGVFKPQVNGQIIG
jgi:ribosomal protein S25